MDKRERNEQQHALTRPAHSLSWEKTLQELDADPSQGFSAARAAERLVEYGPNELKQRKGVRPLTILIQQIFNAMTLVLIMALAASFGIQAWIAGSVLSGIVLVNIFIGFTQSLHAAKTIDALRTLACPTCTVLRDGTPMQIQVADVVPGDIIYLHTGDSVPADIRLMEAFNLEADEALLTGESAPVSKSPELTFAHDTGPGDRFNVVYSSTTITKGRGRGVVFATGMFTEIGAIASALNGHDRILTNEHDAQPLPSRFDPVKQACSVIKTWAGEFLGLTVGTPLQKKLSQLFLWLFCFAIVCAIIVLGANKFQTSQDVVLYAVTTSVGTIPVSLLLVLTVTMAAGAKKMLERHVIVRNLASLEALGGVTNICSDKTGTITQGRMVVRKAWIPGCGTYSVEISNQVYDPTAGEVSFTAFQPREMAETEKGMPCLLPVVPRDEVATKPALQWHLNAASLANLATLDREPIHDSGNPATWKARGTPTEIAIEVFAARFGWSKNQLVGSSESVWQHIAEFPFDSDVKRMSALFHNTQTRETHVFTKYIHTTFPFIRSLVIDKGYKPSKGAVERVLDICSHIATDDCVQQLTEDTRSGIIDNMMALAGQGLRVLALAHGVHDEIRRLDCGLAQASVPHRDHVEQNLIFRGLLGIQDPPRPESLASVQACQRAGIVVHMLTGDHAQTARAIAQEVSILPSTATMRMLSADTLRTMLMTAHEFDALSAHQLDRLPQLPLVVARCAPSTKVRMIEALHRRGCHVAMTGDGVNDSPSLKRADVGIAMGTGSDVARDAADIVLTNDDFASILSAVEEGRRIFDNIQKFILHVLAANIGFVISLLAGLAFKDSSHVSVFLLTPVEILWMLMATGAFCETGLGFEKADEDILSRPPHNLKQGVFTPEFLLDMLLYSTLMASCTITSFTVVLFRPTNSPPHPPLGTNCNNEYNPSCHTVFRARATSYTTLTWIFLLFAWQLIHPRRSLFHIPEPAAPAGGARARLAAWALQFWRNKFLFFSVCIPFVAVLPTLYIPVVNTVVFMHEGISWEWAVVLVAVGVYMLGTEAWKWSKRVYCRRTGPRTGFDGA
ncbi:hypothetical protein E4U55_005658 [Claviceps digitariae]|nr:hypothetical protein E4U55_005658 [Claviceps digitariae]